MVQQNLFMAVQASAMSGCSTRSSLSSGSDVVLVYGIKGSFNGSLKKSGFVPLWIAIPRSHLSIVRYE